MKLKTLIPVLFLLFCLDGKSEEGFFKPNQLLDEALSFESANDGLVKIDYHFTGKSPDAYGNSFFISKRGHLLMNAHVAWGCIESEAKKRDPSWYQKVIVEKKGYQADRNDPGFICDHYAGWIESPSMQTHFPIRILFIPQNLKFASENDFILAVSENFTPSLYFALSSKPSILNKKVFSLSYAPFTDRHTMRIQQNLYKNGNREFRISKGNIFKNDSRYDYSNNQNIVSADIDALAGSSGSPLVNEKGEVVGMLVGPGSASKESPLCDSLVTSFCEGLIAHIASSYIWNVLSSL